MFSSVQSILSYIGLYRLFHFAINNPNNPIVNKLATNYVINHIISPTPRPHYNKQETHHEMRIPERDINHKVDCLRLLVGCCYFPRGLDYFYSL